MKQALLCSLVSLSYLERLPPLQDWGEGGREGALDASEPPGCAEWEGHPLLRQFPRLGMNGGGSGPTPVAVPAPLTKSPSFSVTAFLSAL